MPAIIDDETFDAASRIRAARDPKSESAPKTKAQMSRLADRDHPGEQCGKAMTLATGKSGRYKYYRCCGKISINVEACSTPNVPMERMDHLKVLERLVDRVLDTENVTRCLKTVSDTSQVDVFSGYQGRELSGALKAAR